jgi:Tol biopolymer transport system component
MPDSDLIVEDEERESSSLYVVSLATGEKRLLPPSERARFLGENFGIGYDFDVSPDGKSLAFAKWFSAGTSELYVTPMANWSPRRLTSDNAKVNGLTWTVDASEIIFASNRRDAFALWRIAPDDSQGTEPRSVAGAGDGASFPVSSRGSLGPSRLAYERRVAKVNIWTIDTSQKGSSPVQLIATTGQEIAPQLSPDGQRIAFASGRTGNMEIWMCDKDD